MKIIITDVNSRKVFDIINILESKYRYELLLFAPTGYRFQLPLIYGQKVHRLRMNNFDEFRDDLLNVLNKDSDEEFIYIPVSEEPTLLFYELLDENPNLNIKYLLPQKSTLELTRDKRKFQAFCEENGFPVPRSYNRENLSELRNNFHPVVAKEKIGAGSVGMKYIDKLEQLTLLDNLDFNEYVIQEKIESNKKIHGGFYLCREGEVMAYHSHERIRTFPENGGVTVFSKAGCNKKLKVLGEGLLKKLNWNGFAMIEFLYDDSTKNWKMIELNPRLWGSIMLTEYCGSGLLDRYIRLTKGESLSPAAIETDRYIRWIFPFEMISLVKGKINWKEFINTSKKEICYINFTYSGFFRAVLFQIYFTVNGRSIQRFFKKIFS